jgi:FKBP-type peptidyl-prolyl cis-trans isomerase SlyD
MNVSDNKVVSVSYELKVQGEIVDMAESTNPMEFIYGRGMLIKAFEDNINNMKVGDSFDFQIQSADAYGHVNKDYILKLPKNIFEVEGVIEADLLEVGKRLPMVDQEGNHLNGLVLDVQDDHVVMDFNHPLAGDDLHFTGKVESIREATPEELDHGHIHSHKHDGTCCGGH